VSKLLLKFPEPVVYQTHSLCVLSNLLGRMIEPPASSKRQRDPETVTVVPLQQWQNNELSEQQSVDPVGNKPAAVNQTHLGHKNGKQVAGSQGPGWTPSREDAVLAHNLMNRRERNVNPVAGSQGPGWTPTCEETEAGTNLHIARPAMELMQVQMNKR